MKKICSVEDCDRSAFCKGMCEMHYKRNKRQHEAAEKKALAVASNPLLQLKEVAVQCNVPQKIIDRLIKRLEARYSLVGNNKKTKTRLTVRETIEQLEEKIANTLEHIDEYALSEAKFRDLTIGLGVLIDKKQLLSGEPTQILTIEERKNITELMPFLFKEAQRRGITIDVTPDEPTRLIQESKAI